MVKKRKKYSVWSAEDINYIIQMRGKETIKDMAKKLNKSIISVKKKFAAIKQNKINISDIRPELHPPRNNTKLNWNIINNIRKDWLSNIYTVKQLNDKYTVNVVNIIQNKTWKDPLYKPPKKKRGKSARLLNKIKEIQKCQEDSSLLL